MYNTDDDFAGLILIPGVGRAKAKALFSAGFRTMEDIAKADPAELAKLPGISLEKAREIIDFCIVMDSSDIGSDKLEAQNELFICPLCGSMVGAGSSVCPNCGITFSDEVDDIEPDMADITPSDKSEKDGFWYKERGSLFICPECGSLVSDGAAKCPKCGVQFAADEEEEEPEQTELPKEDKDGFWYKDDTALFMCPNCGSFIRKDAESCGACGIVFEADEDEEEAPVTPDIVCPMCKSSLPAGSDSCRECGFDFVREKEDDGFWYKSQSELFMCPDCGAFIPKNAHECTNCGAVLEEDDEAETERPTCPMCKGELKHDAKTCDNCGFDFTVEKEKDGFWYEDKQVALFICPNCGAFLSEEANNCLNCGMVFDEDGESVGVTPDAEKGIASLTDDLDSYLQEQVDDLIEEVEIEEGVEEMLSASEDVLKDEPAKTPAEPESAIDILPHDSMYICPVCGAFIQANMAKCPSCNAVFDDIEEMMLESAQDIVKSTEEIATEVAAEIREIEAEFIGKSELKKERKGVSKDFLDRWKKLDTGTEDEGAPVARRKKAGKPIELSEEEIDEELGLGDVLASDELIIDELTALERDGKERDHSYWKEKAWELAAQGRLEEAVAFLDRAVEHNPEREMEYKRLMLELMGVGPSEKPVDISELVSVDDIGDLAIDEALISESNIKRLEDIERELSASQNNGSLWQEKGDILEKLGRHQEAVVCFDKSIKISYSELRKDASGKGRKVGRPALNIGLTNGMGRVNGRVNGLLAQRGLINGGLTNGKINGLVRGKTNGLIEQKGLINGSLVGLTNGKINGLYRGKTNGLVEQKGLINGSLVGLTNGRVNGLSRGMVNGRVNGLTNGLSEGLINGTGMGFINGGLVNGLGLVNGEGMVNGTGPLRRLRQRRRERMVWRYRLTAMVLFVTMILMISMVSNLIVQEETEMMLIDGNFADWNDIQSYYNFLEIGTPSPEVRILETRMARENDRLNLFVNFENDVFSNTGDNVNYLWAFIDVDRSDVTGYSMNDMGVDIALEVYGWNRSVRGTNVLRFNPGTDHNDWNGFANAGGATAVCRGRTIEMGVTVPRDSVRIDHNPDVLVVSLDSEGNSDVTNYIMAGETGGVVATFSHGGDDIIEPGTSDVVLGQLNLGSHSGPGYYAAEISFTVAGDCTADDIENPALISPGGDVVPTNIIRNGSMLTFNLSDALSIPANSTRYLELEATIPASSEGKVLGIYLDNVTLNEGEPTIKNLEMILHNIGVPDDMGIDGAFGDWVDMSAIEDPVADVVSQEQNASFINRNVDLVDTRFFTAQNSLFFYLSVHGTIMGGESIPSIRYRPGTGATNTTVLVDTDRDTVPDTLDPHPIDFTNNGIIDSQMLQDGYPDVDGDGVADYPRDRDWWLNTTIPQDFPAPYAGRFVSIYIGPVSTKYTAQKGDDRAYLLMDSDDDPQTGQNLKGGVGIDHVVIISGKDNHILASELYRYEPLGTETGWDFVQNVSIALDWNRMEGAFMMSGLGLTPGDNFTIYIALEDWKGSRDSMEKPVYSGVPATPGTRTPAGDNVVINEVSVFGDAEWVEICNPTNAAINIGTWTIQILAGGTGNYKTIHIFSLGTSIGAFGTGNEYMVVNINKQFPDNKISIIRLVAGTTIVDEGTLPVQVSGTSYARFKNATLGMPTDTNAASDWYVSSASTYRGPNDRTAPSITVVKSGDRINVSPGGIITYYIWYNNTGDGNSRHVWINDTLPTGTAFVSSSIPFSSYSGQVYRWYFTQVSPGPHSFSITARVDSGATAGTVLTNNVALQYTDQLSRLWGSSTDSFETTVVPPDPVLTLAKIADLPYPYPGEIVTFTVYYNNTGTVSAPHVWVNDTLPVGMSYVSGNPAPTTVSGQIVYWYFQDVPVGTNSLLLQIIVGTGVAPGTALTNIVTCDYKDLNGDSQTQLQAQSTVTVANPINSIVINEVASLPNPEWVELCNPSAEPVDIGGWRIQYLQGNWKNTPTFASGSVIGAWGSGTEYLAVSLAAGTLADNGASVRLINAAGQTIDATTYPQIASGQSWSRFKHEDTGKPVDTGNDTNDFYVSNNGWLVPEGPTREAANDRKRPIMDIEKAVSPTTAEPGQTVTYTITYRNTGDGNAKNVWVNDTLPAGMNFTSATPAPTSVSGQKLTWYFNSVNHGTTNYIIITAKVNSLPADGEEMANVATLIYSDALKQTMGTGTAWANVTCSRPVITVEKVADVTTVLAGGTIVYTIYYNNTGSATAGSVWINDTLPAGVTFVSATPAPDTISNQTLGWHLTNVAPGNYFITVTVTVDANATGTLVNWAFLDYSSGYGYALEPDSDSAIVIIPEMRHLAIPIFGMFLIIAIFNNRKQKYNRNKG